MTPEQRNLARHALGLPNDRNRSYRNRFVVSEGAANMKPWTDLVDAGLAELGEIRSRMRWFHLTHAGAAAALDGDERLDPEDFPEEAAHAV